MEETPAGAINSKFHGLQFGWAAHVIFNLVFLVHMHVRIEFLDLFLALGFFLLGLRLH